MLIGVLLLVVTGFSWAFIGVVLSWTAKHKVSPVLAMGLQLGLVTVIALCIMPNYGMMRESLPARFWPLVTVMLVAGGLNAFGMLALQQAMRLGHNGVAWAVSQSALVVPFLVGIVIFGEACTAWRLAGVGAILMSLALFSKTKADVPSAGQEVPGKGYLGYALLALAIFGVGQTLTAMPSQWAGQADPDPAQVRIPLNSFANAGVYAFLWFRRPGVFQMRVLPIITIGAIISMAGGILLYRGMDALAQADMACVIFPITVGTCIVSFGLYSVLFMREPVTKWHIGGMALALAGVLAVSL